ncbi:hypothetical protein EI74_0329 [Mycoplasma testudineum]|uniref:Lipoprotein n=1 Tax=Mycoplasma testudineum TaxID=244584 RepID=A0A4V3C334_9MOLU|nr:hypothetical protein [Mycoplasma testudineum]OYD26950.1 hypothetical protein CG473_01255 [Mycoplasma testudineum]TDO20499.1 hypothetical protein EI74_0329 [Mycoplasma testudineum]
MTKKILLLPAVATISVVSFVACIQDSNSGDKTEIVTDANFENWKNQIEKNIQVNNIYNLEIFKSLFKEVNNISKYNQFLNTKIENFPINYEFVAAFISDNVEENTTSISIKITNGTLSSTFEINLKGFNEFKTLPAYISNQFNVIESNPLRYNAESKLKDQDINSLSKLNSALINPIPVLPFLNYEVLYLNDQNLSTTNRSYNLKISFGQISQEKTILLSGFDALADDINNEEQEKLTNKLEQLKNVIQSQLHVNNEKIASEFKSTNSWEYFKSFITNGEILDNYVDIKIQINLFSSNDETGTLILDILASISDSKSAIIESEFRVNLSGFKIINSTEVANQNKEIKTITINPEISKSIEPAVVGADKTLVYIEPIFNLKFIIYPHYFQEEPEVAKYIFSSDEIKKFASWFLENIDYGPEILELNSVVLNDPIVTVDQKGAKGLYTSFVNQISVNVDNEIISNLNFDQKIESIAPTLKHEYMHHFANVYLDRKGLPASENVEIVTNVGENNSPVESAFSKSFYDQFIDVLRLSDTTENNSYKNTNNPNSQFIGKYFSESELFKMNNSYDSVELKNRYLQLYNSNNGLNWSNREVPKNVNGLTYRNSTSPVALKTLNYEYSFSELIAREWVKIANVTKYNKGNWGNEVQNFWYTKNFENDKLLFPNSFLSDWDKSIELNSNTITQRNGRSDIVSPGYEYIEKDIATMANATYGGKFTNNNGDVSILENRVKDLYNVYLNAMNINNEISTIMFKNDAFKSKTTSENKSSLSYINRNEVKFGGFLSVEKASKYKALVYKDKDDNYYKNEIKFINFDPNKPNDYDNFSFRAKSSFLATSRDLNPWTGSEDNKKIVSWFSSAYINLKGKSNSQFYFWNDINNNDIVEENELVNPLMESQKRISDFVGFIQPTKETKELIVDSNGIVKLVEI